MLITTLVTDFRDRWELYVGDGLQGQMRSDVGDLHLDCILITSQSYCPSHGTPQGPINLVVGEQ